MYLASGEVTIQSSGVDVAVCEPSAFIGEVTILEQGPATATAIVTQPSRYWAADGRVLRQATQANAELRRALERSFSRNTRDKLLRSNRVIAGKEAPAAGTERPPPR